MKVEEDVKNGNDSLLVWDTFVKFESCERVQNLETFVDFFARWKKSLENLEEVGFQYPAQLLILKLLYACHLDNTTVLPLITLISEQAESEIGNQEKILSLATQYLNDAPLDVLGTVDVLDNGPVYGIDDLYDDVEDDKDALFDILELSKKPKIKKEKGVFEKKRGKKRGRKRVPLEDKYPCEECNNSYCTREALAKHMKTKHDMSPPPVKKMKEEAADEEEEAPVKKSEFFCRPCQLKYQSKEALDRHIAKHKPTKCQKCEEVLLSEKAISKHQTRCTVSFFTQDKVETKHLDSDTSNQENFLLPPPPPEVQEGDNTISVKPSEIGIVINMDEHGNFEILNTGPTDKVDEDVGGLEDGSKQIVTTLATQVVQHTDATAAGVIQALDSEGEDDMMDDTHLDQSDLEEDGEEIDIAGADIKDDDFIDDHKLDDDVEYFDCEKCHRIFGSAASLSRHTRLQHAKDNTAGKTGKPKKRDSLPPHWQPKVAITAEGQEIPICDNCGKTGTNWYQMRRHIKLCTTDFYCRPCTVKFSSQANLDKHLAAHVPATCHKCNTVMVAERALRIHLKNSKCADRKMCKYCGKYFSATRIKIHEGSHREDQNHVCPREGCGKSFHNQKALEKHLLRHDNIRNYQCSACDMRFYEPHQAKNHYKDVHQGIRKMHPCDHCGKEFRAPIKLVEHIRTHTGEKPNKCDLCDKAFNKKESLKRHIQRVHLKTGNEKKEHAKCEYCGKEFNKIWNYTTHLKKVHHKQPGLSTVVVTTTQVVPQVLKTELTL